MAEHDRPTILIVDGESIALDALQQPLQSRFDVLPAHSDPEALELLRSRPVQVVVTDHSMPGRSGVEVLAAARAERPEAARVMLTGCTDLQDFADAVNLGGVEYVVTKPWVADELMEVLERAAAMARRAEKETADRRQAEAAAHRAEADLSALIENSDTSLWSLDRDYRLLAFNTHFRDYARQGLGREISKGENILPEVPEAIREEWAGHYDRCLRGESFCIVTPTVPPLPLRVVEYRFNPIRLADGQVAGLTVFAIDVTDRCQAEANLAASEKRYRELYQSLMDAYVQVDMRGRIVQYNETFRAMLGYSDDQLRRRTYVDLTPEKWHANDQKIISEQILPLGYSEVHEKEYRRKDGTVFPIELRTFLIRDEAGRPESMWALIRDISERKQAELALAESQTLLNSIVNSTTDLIWSVEAPSFELLTFNQAFFDYFLQVLGVRARKGMHPADLLPTAELAQTWLAFYQRALKEGSYTTDYEMQTSRRTLLLSINVLEREGAVWGISVFAHDITERKQAEAALRRSEAKFRAVVENSSEGILFTDAGAKVRYRSPSVSRIDGYPDEERVGQAGFATTHPDDLETVHRYWADVLQHPETSLRSERRIRHKDGTWRWIEVATKNLLDNPNVQAIVIASRDITERKRAEAALHESQERYRSLFEYSPISLWEEDFSGVRAYLDDLRRQGVTDFEAYLAAHPEAAAEGMRRIRVLDVNEATLRLYGAPSKAEFLSQTEQFLRLETQAIMILELAALARGEREFEAEGVNYRLTGERLDVFVRWVVSPGAESHVLVSIIDITERKRAEEALRASEVIFHNLFNNTEVAMLRSRLDGSESLNANEKFLELVGCTRDEVIGKPSVLHWADPAQHDEMIRALKANGQVIDLDCKIINKSGEVRDCITSLKLYPEEGILEGSIRDITERKQAEAEIRRHAARAEALVQTAARLNGQLDLNKTVQAVCEETARALNVPVAVVDLYDQRRRALCYAADVGLPAELRGYALPMRREALASPLAPAPANAGLLAALNSPATAAMALRRDDGLIGAVRIFALDAARQFTADELALLRGLADHASQAIMNARLYEQVRAGREQLQMLSRQLVEAQETERQALAHELHDQIGQNLTGLSLNLNILRNQLSAEAAAPLGRRLDDSLALVSETMQRIRNVMAELRPPALDDYGLLAALRWHGEQLTARTGLKVRVEGVEATPRLAPPEENALFRIAQEALTNAVKHAKATQAVITLEAEPGLIRLTVEDDGGGFSPAGRRRPGSHGGWGLTFMRERAIAIGGQLHVESASGQGTRIIVEVRR